jgi:diaminopimelate decarboxylase
MYEIKEHLENKNWVLHIGNLSTVELAEKYGTPLYVYDEETIRSRYKKLVTTFKKHYQNFKCFYAVKANNNLAILKILKDEGAGLDCSCPAEIFLGKKVGFTKMLYSGVYLRDDEIEYGINANITINLEDVSQIDRLVEKCKQLNKFPEVISFRINPGIGKGNVEGNVFGGKDAKFGVIEEQTINAYRRAKEAGFKKFGIHMMTGSCLLEPDYFESITIKLLDIAGKIKKELDINFEFVDIGGGFGITYNKDEKDLDIEETAERVTTAFKQKCEEHNLGEPTLMVEPGRYLTCEAGILLTRVTSIKNGYKKFVGVDAGMNTLMRPALYNANHETFIANDLMRHTKEEEFETVSIVGPICENTDQFHKDKKFPVMKENNLLVMLNCGSYGFTMGSQYNNRPMCAEVLVNKGEHRVIRRRQTFEDLTRDMIE